jgi:hypothetical protein
MATGNGTATQENFSYILGITGNPYFFGRINFIVAAGLKGKRNKSD